MLKPGFDQKHLQDTVELFTILVIVISILILAKVSDIGPTPAVGVLSGIARYVLGCSSCYKYLIIVIRGGLRVRSARKPPLIISPPQTINLGMTAPPTSWYSYNVIID